MRMTTDQPKETNDMTDDQTNDRLVGLPAIAAVVGVCVVTMRKIARDPSSGCPVSKVGGRWWASRRAVVAWMADQTSAGAGRRQNRKAEALASMPDKATDADIDDAADATGKHLEQMHRVYGLSLESVLIGAHAQVVTEMTALFGGPFVADVMRRAADRVEDLQSLDAAILAAAPVAGRA